MATKNDDAPQPKKPVATLHIDQNDANADWIKWRSRESELAIHAEVAKRHKARQQVAEAKRATLLARAAALEAKVDKATADDAGE